MTSEVQVNDLAARPLTIDGVELLVAPLGGLASEEHLVLVKPMEEVDAYRELLARFTNPRMVELGIMYGGSVAFHALVADPELLVALELHDERIELLDRLIEARGLSQRVQLHYGVDQADVGRVRDIATAAMGGEPLDIVIDDASHLYGPTVASFEVLFPLLRPGGLYIIEDWPCDHDIRRMLVQGLADPASPLHGWAQQAAEGGSRSRHEGQQSQADISLASLDLLGEGVASPGPPLSRIASELILGPADPTSGIASVSTNRFWIAVERSDAPLDGSYRMAPHELDPFGTLVR